MKNVTIDGVFTTWGHDQKDYLYDIVPCSGKCTECVIAKRTLSNGRAANWLQCAECKRSIRALSNADVDAAVRVGATVRDFDDSHQAKVEAHYKRREEGFVAERSLRRAYYESYINSDEWKQKRAAVLQRDGGVCRGCGNKKADDVHHLTYDHLGDELLFELVSVCRACHERIHPHMRGHK